MRVSNIIIFHARNMSRDTYRIMGKWKSFTTLQTFKVSVKVSTIKSKGFAKVETY